MVPEGIHVVRHYQHNPGPSVVLVHGAPDRAKNLAHVVHLLHDVPVTTYDRRGYGKSLAAGSVGPGGFEQHADDLLQLLDGTPAIVVGQSAGGAIAMAAAIKAPHLFLALGAWEPPMVPWKWWSTIGQWEATMKYARYHDPYQLGEDFNRNILGDERWEALPARTRELLRAEGVAFRADMSSQEFPFMEVERLRVPVVIGVGTEHPHAEFARCNRETARRTNAELYVGEGADHFAHLGNPAVWVGLVRQTVALARRSHPPEVFA
ncbi:MAG: alpha/beta hydrolase [Actinomycetota bacterium]|nr:alpha/beta hydrolase [Actinomycetota bacterium]